MSRQQGRGGIGSHKHGISGKSGLPPGLKQQLAREDNQRRKKKEHKQPMYDSVSEMMKQHRRI